MFGTIWFQSKGGLGRARNWLVVGRRGPVVKSGLGCVLYADQMIAGGEGISLAADVFTTDEVKGRYPAILVYAAYKRMFSRVARPRARMRRAVRQCLRTVAMSMWW